MKIAYEVHNFTASTMELIDAANIIIEEYQEQGFRLTLRQLYYQFVARDWIENSYSNYKRIGNVISKGRLAGYIDWSAIEDRTRRVIRNSHWDDEQDAIKSIAKQFAIDKWDNQPSRIEVWIEKEALSGVIQPVCKKLDIPFFACKGYPSMSSVYKAARRMAWYNDEGQNVHILHLGDHDPSGIDMTRDIDDRIRLLAERMVSVDRLALNFEQIEVYDPPPNFTKLKDSRASGYVAKYGLDSWELDALEPVVLAEIIENAVLNLRDEEEWDKDVAIEEAMIDNLNEVHERWADVRDALELD